jgi:hypothetical protein
MDEGFTDLKGQLNDMATLQNNEQGHLPVSMLPETETLIGREDIMEKLENAWKDLGKAALVGGGGMGKKVAPNSLQRTSKPSIPRTDSSNGYLRKQKPVSSTTSRER